MSVSIFGASVLDEVHEESLSQLLSDLRSVYDPEPQCLLSIPTLDRLLDLFRYPHRATNHGNSTATGRVDHDEFGGTQAADSRADLDAGQPSRLPSTPGFIEFSHSTSNTDSTDLLYHIVAASILPRIHHGKEASVVWLDTEISFSATRLHQICIQYLSQENISLSPSSQHTIAQDALKHVHVFSISSSKQLLSVLNGLDSYLLQQNHDGAQQTIHQSLHRALSVIVLDSASAFYWTDRFDADMARLEAITVTGNSNVAHSTQTQPHPSPASASTSIATQVITKLKSLQATFECVCMYTTGHHLTTTTTTTSTVTLISTPTPTSALIPNPISAPPSSFFSPWTTAATLSLSLAAIPVPQFASHMTLAGCLVDREKRQEVVGRGRVRVGVNEEWLAGVVKGREIRERIRGLDGRGAFVVRIGEMGVVVE